MFLSSGDLDSCYDKAIPVALKMNPQPRHSHVKGLIHVPLAFGPGILAQDLRDQTSLLIGEGEVLFKYNLRRLLVLG